MLVIDLDLRTHSSDKDLTGDSIRTCATETIIMPAVARAPVETTCKVIKIKS